MIDSGSTFSYLISSEYRVFVQAFHSALGEALRRANRTFPAVKRLRVGMVESWKVGTRLLPTGFRGGSVAVPRGENRAGRGLRAGSGREVLHVPGGGLGVLPGRVRGSVDGDRK